MNPFTKTIIGGLLLAAGLFQASAQGITLETRYLKLQEAYTQKLQEIETEHQQSERELLNQFILSLPRIEKAFKDEGNLEGVVATRGLQDQVLSAMAYPEQVDQSWPEPLLNQVNALIRQRNQARQENQAKLNEINTILLNALEPYKKAFTKAGNLDRALEIRDMQLHLAEHLNLGEEGGSPVANSGEENVNNDPNAFPFCMEPAIFQGQDAVSPRTTAVEFEPNLQGRSAILEDGFRFENGRITLPPNAMNSVLTGVKKSQMLSMEIGLVPIRRHQGSGEFPAVIYMYGTELSKSNLVITQEGPDFFLYLRTTMGPNNGRPMHRIHLGPAEPGRAQHISFTYRSGELTVFRNGSQFNKLRGTPTGLLNNWVEAPVIMGENDKPPNLPNLPPRMPWFGHVFNISIRTATDSARKAEENFNRFRNAIVR